MRSPGGDTCWGADICSDFFKFQDYCPCEPAHHSCVCFGLLIRMEALRQIQFDWDLVTSPPDILLKTNEWIQWQKMFPAHEGILHVSWQMFSVVIPFSFLSGTQIQFQWELAFCGCCAGLAGGGAYPAGSPVLLQEFGEWRHCSRMRLCPVETMRHQFERSQSLEMMSERHSCFLGRFRMENLMSLVLARLGKGERCTWKDQDILHWLITRCLMSNELTLPSVHVLHHSSVIHSS